MIYYLYNCTSLFKLTTSSLSEATEVESRMALTNDTETKHNLERPSPVRDQWFRHFQRDLFRIARVTILEAQRLNILGGTHRAKFSSRWSISRGFQYYLLSWIIEE